MNQRSIDQTLNVEVTVLVPAFKVKYLTALLESLCAQTDGDFLVLLCDDASPEPIEAVFNRFEDKLKIRYLRFENNLGGKDLANHFNRCVSHVDTEWIIMPGDDDILDPRCIEQLRQAVIDTKGRHAAYRATLRGIDANGFQRYLHHPKHLENPTEGILALLEGDYCGTIIEYLFSKSRLAAIGGFVPFPLGWYSDTASWIALAGEGGIAAVDGAIANHRISDISISNDDPSLDEAKLSATLSFIKLIRLTYPEFIAHDESYHRFLDKFVWIARSSLAKLETGAFLRNAIPAARAIGLISKEGWQKELLRCTKYKLGSILSFTKSILSPS
jgi:glycosyltransferase involved in cell wall biosynthesis